MPVPVRIPTPLRKLTQNQEIVQIEGATIRDLINNLEQSYPGLKERICDEQNNIRRFVNVFVNDEDKGEIVVIDPKAMTIKAHWPMSTADKKCEGPSGLAIDKKNHRLFSTCDNLMVITDSQSGKVVAQVPTGPGTDAAGFDPGTMNAFASCGGDRTNPEGTLTVVIWVSVTPDSTPPV